MPNKSILVVDDEVDLREVIVEFFEIEGYKVFGAACIKEGIEIFDTEAIDFVISDVTMPEGSGIELLAYVHEKKPQTPFLILSGYSDISREFAIEKGAIDVFPKPTNLGELVAYVNKNIGK